MTPEEEIYIRKTVKNTDHGLEKLFTSKNNSFNRVYQFFFFSYSRIDTS